MSKTIELRLSDAQCDALAREAEAAGLKFFDHCRAKLLANMTTPADTLYGRGPAMLELPHIKRRNERALAEIKETDRLDRLEAMMLDIAERLVAGSPPVIQAAETESADIDIDDIVSQSLGEAERQGLTVVERQAAPATAGGVRHVGTRPPAPFSPSTQPRHLNGL